MSRLSSKDFDLMNRAILELYSYRDADDFARAVPGIFLSVISADFFTMLDAEVPSGGGKMKAVGFWESERRIDRAVIRAMEDAVAGHPFTRYTAEGGSPTALKISVAFTTHQFQNSALYQEFCRRLDARRLLAAACFLNEDGLSTLNVSRDSFRYDFTERDRLMLNLLRPHFIQARRNAILATAERKAPRQTLEAYRLTPREMEIAGWVGRGKTNSEIAVILRAKPRTIEKHMENILEKLGVENRTAAAVLIAQRGDGA